MKNQVKRHTTIEVLLLVGLFLSGAAALIYEVAWVRALSLVMGSTTHALSTMLASFMAGLTLGGYLGGLWADRVKSPAFTFGLLELGIAIFGIITLIITQNLSPLYAWVFYTFHLSFSSFSLAQFALSFMTMLIPTALMGATFPLVLKARAKNLNELGRETGDVYSINNLGAVLGSFAAGFILIPTLGVTTTNMVAATLNMVVALMVLSISKSSFKIWGIGAGVVLFSISSFFSMYSKHPSYIFNYYKATRFTSYDSFQEFNKWKRLLFEKEGVQGLVQVFTDTRDGHLLLMNDGRIEGSVTRIGDQIGGSTSIDWINQLLTAYLPLEANPGARSFLNIGLGTGTTLRAAMSDTDLREIDFVEINPAVVEAVESYFYPGLQKDPRVRFIVADARNYLSLVHKRYDIITSQPSYPGDQGMSNLFSLEFFRLVRARLTEGGVFAQWLPGYLLSEEDKRMMIRTFGIAFPYTYVWQIDVSEDIILLGSDGPLTSPDKLLERVESMKNAKGLGQDYRLWLMPEDVRDIVEKGGIINTDDMPILEFVSARNMLDSGHGFR